MPQIALIPLAMITPFLLLGALLLPTYLAILAVGYIVYYPESGTHPLADKWYDVFTIADMYQRLFIHWQHHAGELSFWQYTLPIIGLPLLAIVLSFFLLRWLLRWLGDVFHLTTGGH